MATVYSEEQKAAYKAMRASESKVRKYQRALNSLDAAIHDLEKAGYDESKLYTLTDARVKIAECLDTAVSVRTAAREAYKNVTLKTEAEILVEEAEESVTDYSDPNAGPGAGYGDHITSEY